MEIKRSLLTIGVGKLGEGIHAWSLPAVTTCPGRTSVCEGVCYSNNRGRFRFEQVKERLAWNLKMSRRKDFVDLMSKEIGRRGCQVIRVHVSGDHYSREYAEKWLAVMKRKPKPRYFFFTRSWRIVDIAPVLEEMALLPQCRVWYSIDREAMPDKVPKGVRLAYLQTQEGEEPELLDLRFAVRRLRNKRTPLPLLCPHERGVAENCGDCGRCFR